MSVFPKISKFFTQDSIQDPTHLSWHNFCISLFEHPKISPKEFRKISKSANFIYEFYKNFKFVQTLDTFMLQQKVYKNFSQKCRIELIFLLLGMLNLRNKPSLLPSNLRKLIVKE